MEFVLAHRRLRTHARNWSLSPTFTGTVPHTRYMDIDAAASTPILR
jgi:hypothetical protein